MNRVGDNQLPQPERPPRDASIPLRPADLVRMLGDEPPVTIFERQQFRQLAQLLEATIHDEYRSRLNELKAAYAPFDPDDDSAVPYALSEDEHQTRCDELFEHFNSLLERANYRRLKHEEIAAVIASHRAAGTQVRVDLTLFERLEVYVRGQCTLPAQARDEKKAAAQTAPADPAHSRRTTAGYRRLALIFRLRRRSPLTDPLDTRGITLKLFKDIPHARIDTLLPGGSIRIGLIEQARIVVPTVSGLGLTLFKLLNGAAASALAGLYSLLTFLALIGGAIGYGVRSFYGYLQTREKHQLSLTRHLYFQNLDNNAGVIYHLLGEAEEQEFREAMLAWWLLWRGELAGATAQQIDLAAESWLRERCSIDIDFEVADALAKLRRLGLAEETAGHRWHGVSIEEALARLDETWDQRFDEPRPPAMNPATARPRIWRQAA
jgi:hypothetical protein